MSKLKKILVLLAIAIFGIVSIAIAARIRTLDSEAGTEVDRSYNSSDELVATLSIANSAFYTTGSLPPNNKSYQSDYQITWGSASENAYIELVQVVAQDGLGGDVSGTYDIGFTVTYQDSTHIQGHITCSEFSNTVKYIIFTFVVKHADGSVLTPEAFAVVVI